MSPRLVAIRRFPVKSMGGEALDRADVSPRGIAGDRGFAVITGDGRFASGKNSKRFQRREAVFGYRARTLTSDDASAALAARSAPDAVTTSERGGTVLVWRERSIWPVAAEEDRERNPRIDFVADPGGPWRTDDPALLDDLRTRIGDDVDLHRTDGTDFFDASPLSLVGTATVTWARREFGADSAVRRLRANLLVETTEPFAEEAWVGRTVRIGGTVTCTVDRVISRCRMIDLDQDGVADRTSFLHGLTATRGPNLAVYLGPRTPGVIAVGDTLSFGDA
ncbi:MOSC domain-containing protein [Pseudoclavibacter endophyticus]|uniref:MOSC domain-containing protein n=1 Tax=Pseudoclavibacter endophyticus TaxID=1778590 RepID=A0A6H9WT49_9MICO|nr:MOSC N-terminal beta barrel domain-containing protein [Pseudoclavibacter endophyticus]KAB1649564.1 MOSC domain-containing protein [Pseudoclavibacter endophyticus]